MQQYVPDAKNLKALLFAFLLLLSCSVQASTQIAYWDFRRGVQGWTANKMATRLRVTPEGLTLTAEAPDPFLVSPVVNCPEGRYLSVGIRMRSNSDALGQIYYGAAFKEQDSRPFRVSNDSKWHDYTVSLPPLGTGVRFRLDPCHNSGKIDIAWVSITASPEPPQEMWASPKELRRKKSIAAGQYGTNGGESAVTSRFLAKHPSFPATFPYDGYVIPAVVDSEWCAKMGLERRDYFLHELLWNNVKIPREAIVPIVKDLQSVKWGGVTDNFLNYSMTEGTRGRFIPDFADDNDWAIVEQNAASAARLCREANLKGFWLDTEQYSNYRWRAKSGVAEFEPNRPANLKFPLGKDSPETLRKRGAQWIRAVQRELPAVKIIITFAWSEDAVSYGPLKGVIPFLNGVLDAIEAPAQLIHGYENTFYYGQGAGTTNVVNDGRTEGYPGGRARFEVARANIRNWRTLSDNPQKYDRFVKIGMAGWVEDDPWNAWDKTVSGVRWSLWSNLQLALAYSDEYVWVWSEHTKYGQPENTERNPFLASLSNQTFNTGAEEVVALKEAFASDPLERGWHFDFDMLAIGRKQPAHAVALMDPASLPYRWDRGQNALSVFGAWQPGGDGGKLRPSAKQRKRYVHPVKPVQSADRFSLSFDFQIASFGQNPANPITMGLFNSDIAMSQSSLTLQIRSATEAVIVCAFNGRRVLMALPLRGAIALASNYRFSIRSEGYGKLYATLQDSNKRPMATFRATLNSLSGFAWNEIGIALIEGVVQPETRSNAYQYKVLAAQFEAPGK